MCSWPRILAALAISLLALQVHAQKAPGKSFEGIGRAATPAEVAAWDIDVRPDFKGLPPGSGTVAKGQQVWETKCASCHGVFGESNEVYTPLVGGTNAEDIRTGTVGSLKRRDHPGRTTFMKLSSISSLWDYIRRAMPWNEPKSLTVDEVYAVTAYMLNLAAIVPDDFTLSDATMGVAQQRLPNRNGMTTRHALWPGREFGGTASPDVRAALCMSNCEVPAASPSVMPDHARNAHGNLAEQNRLVGAQRGAATLAMASSGNNAAAGARPAASKDTVHAQALVQKHNCTACHAAETKLVGPSWSDISKKHHGNAAYLAGKIRAGGSGVWGTIPMPPQPLEDDELKRIAAWLAQGMSR
jgi:S-disulfanyl-L-cysteine oxidoreductase SoxD